MARLLFEQRCYRISKPTLQWLKERALAMGIREPDLVRRILDEHRLANTTRVASGGGES